MFHTIKLPDGTRLVLSVEDIVSMREVECPETAFGQVRFRMRTGDIEVVDDPNNTVVDGVLAAALGYAPAEPVEEED